MGVVLAEVYPRLGSTRSGRSEDFYPHSPGSRGTYAGPGARDREEQESAFQIVRILVVGVETPSGLRSTRPSAYFSAFKVLEYDV